MSDNGHGADPSPAFLPGGQRVTQGGLREKIEAQFAAENEERFDLYAAAESAQRDALREVIEYVLATDSITVGRTERGRLLDELHRDLFQYGPLTDLIVDESVSEIAIRSATEVFVRRGADDPQSAPAASFRDTLHLERLIARLLRPTGYDFRRESLIEAGGRLGSRPARLNILGLPLSPVLQVTMRLHPSAPLSLTDLVVAGMLDPAAAGQLRAILAGGFGLMIAGEVGAGKTTLLNALLAELPSASVSVVERAAELRPPPTARLFTAAPEAPFPAQLLTALDASDSWLVVDEVRFDESAEMWAAITADRQPRLLWAFRGSTDATRLRTAFSMAVRRARQGIGQEFIVSGLLDRLPFVAFLARRDKALRLLRIGEWVGVPDDPQAVQLNTVWSAESGSAPSQRLG
jgi:type IV secretory pathway ATPase VirB11/archaellum biosynthesis ATPase